jgi:hypothetical protein
MLAFTPEKMDDTSLIGLCRAATGMLSGKDVNFAQRMNLLDEKTRMNFSNQVFAPTMHTPQIMQSTLAGWLKNQNIPFEPRLGDTFFPHGMRDAKGRENYVLIYFDLKE